MKVLLDSLHLNVHTQEFYPNKLQPHEIKSKPVSGSERVKYHLHHQRDSIYCNKYNLRYYILWKRISIFYLQFVSNQIQ